MKKTNIEQTRINIKDYITKWSYTFIEDAFHKRNFDLLSKVAESLKTYPISSYEFWITDISQKEIKVLSWSDQNIDLKSSCISVEKV